MQRLTQRPVHIPAGAVYEFDIFRDPALLEEPHERALQLAREAPPLFWTPHHGGHWLAVGYELAHFVLRTPELFSSVLLSAAEEAAKKAALPPGIPRFPELKPVMMDPPEHTQHRLPLQRTFAPKTIMALKEHIAVLAHELLDAVAADGKCEFIGAVAEQLPVRVFLKMMGLPETRLVEFRELVREVFKPSNYDPMIYGMRARRIADAMMEIIQARRREPRDDLISRLWALDVDGQPMTLELMEDYSVLLFLAGLDTVVNAIAFGMRHLARDPALQHTLRNNPALIPEATEELLRRYSFTIPIRRVVTDTELGGHALKAGDRIMLYLPAADLDAREFPAPDIVDVHRENKTHIIFGAGPHRCLGSHLARLELQVLYAAALEKLPAFRLDTDKPLSFHTGQMLALSSLPLRWD